jgi:hypothetical protein
MTYFIQNPCWQWVLTFHTGLNHPISAVELIFGGVNVVICLYHEKQQITNTHKVHLKAKLHSLRKDVRIACLPIVTP